MDVKGFLVCIGHRFRCVRLLQVWHQPERCKRNPINLTTWQAFSPSDEEKGSVWRAVTDSLNGEDDLKSCFLSPHAGRGDFPSPFPRERAWVRVRAVTDCRAFKRIVNNPG